jgi:hypothetical protein
MAAISTMIIGATAIAGLGLSGAGMYQSYQGQKRQAASQQEAIRLQQQMDDQRKKAMELDAMRRKREMIRQSIAARSMALATTTALGASAEGSSALPGSYGGIQGRTGVNELGVNQNLEIGRSMFGLQRGVSAAYQNAASAGSQVAMGQGLSSLGGTLLKNLDTFGRVGSFMSGGFGASARGGGGWASPAARA